MRFLGSSADAEGRSPLLSGSAVNFLPRSTKACLGHSAAGKERNIRPNRPSKLGERRSRLSPLTPPPCCDAGDFFFAPIIALLIESSSKSKSDPNLRQS